jgi:arylsulfatase
VKPGSVSDFVTGFEDWMPTLLDLIHANTQPPAELDGISIADTLRGREQPARTFLYREFTGYGGQQAVWLGTRWKGIRQNLNRRGRENAEPELKTELYNLEADVSESHDVAASHPAVLAEIEQLMKQERTPSRIFRFPALDNR